MTGGFLSLIIDNVAERQAVGRLEWVNCAAR